MDLDRDADIDSSDETWLDSIDTAAGTATNYPFADLDADGDVDATDLSTLQTNRAAGLTPTELTYSGLDNPFMESKRGRS